MEKVEQWLRTRPRLVLLLLALVVTYALCSGGVVTEDMMPVGDSEHYVIRGMTLYGYLHTGQWAHFWDVFTLPRQSLAPPYYWIFFLVPQAWAGITSYGMIQAATTYGLMALGSWLLCRALDRAAWAPALFLLCASQNVSLDAVYFYYVDVPFCAVGMVALAWQIQAWRQAGWKASLLSGAGPGLMFWLKSGNALIFAVTYLLAEIAWMVLLEVRRGQLKEPAAGRRLARHVAGVVAGFIPVAFLALACGGGQSIIKLIAANEVSDLFVSTVSQTGLLRLIYFPLCLSYFYHVELLLFLGIVVAVVTAKRCWEKPEPVETASTPFPAWLLIPLLIAYGIYGEFYSFGMQDKEPRGLLILLPVFWLGLFWACERCRVRTGAMFLAAAAYVACGYGQIFSDALGSREMDPMAWDRFPPPRVVASWGPKLSRDLLNTVEQQIPEGGKVAVGSEQLYLTSESIEWMLDHQQALLGQESRYDFENFLTVKGEINRDLLVGSRGILIYVNPGIQYSQPVYQMSFGLSQYAAQEWVARQHIAQMVAVQATPTVVLGYLIIFKEPLRDDQITEAMDMLHAAEFKPAKNLKITGDVRLTWAECWDVLQQWEQKRLGW